MDKVIVKVATDGDNVQDMPIEVDTYDDDFTKLLPKTFKKSHSANKKFQLVWIAKCPSVELCIGPMVQRC